jgi:hypothetical protein
MGTWTPLYLLLCAVFVWRACREPLAGVDNEFRWSYLAGQMLREGSLGFYPPQTADDFLKYFWPESIPPGVASLYAWCYACGGTRAAGWTVPVVLLQFWALQDLLWRAGHELGGERAARFACLAAAACPLLTWSLLLAQETGLLVLSVLGILLALAQWRRTGHASYAALAGFFAVLGAIAREYGPVLPVATAVALVALRADRRAWLAFAAIALPLATVWPLRVAALTGNPFYSLPLAGLPANARFTAIISLAAETFAAPLHSLDGWLTLGRYLISYAPAALLGVGALIFAVGRGRRCELLLLAAAALFVALWLSSVRYTTGGLFYSLRVTAPAVAIGAVAAGVLLAAVPAQRIGSALMVALVILTLPATLALPNNPWRTPWRQWAALSEAPAGAPSLAAVQLVRAAGAPGVVLSDSAGDQPRFASAGYRVAPLWSPQADWLFDASLTPDEAVHRWRESGIRYVVLASVPGNRAGFDYLRAHAAWMRPPFRWRALGEADTSAVFALELQP